MTKIAYIKQAFQDSSPVFFGLFPTGIVFGYLMQTEGYSWYWAPLMSFLANAGSSQFVAMSMMAAGQGLVDIISAVALVNARHLFYGLSLFDIYPQRFFSRFYMIFGLSDEAFGILTTSKHRKAVPYIIAVSFALHMIWFGGTLAGTILASSAPQNVKGMEFCLTALFVVLMIEQALSVKKIFPFVVGSLASLSGFLFFPSHMLIGAIGLSAFSLSLRGVREQRNG
ncbi:MAG: AzlC family ABC transporter permease [Oligoflexales bacterium]